MMNAVATAPRSSAWWAVVIASVTVVSTVTALVLVSMRATDGHFVYALDDPYIHMAIARTLAHSGVWGVTPHGFTSSSSSLLWTSVLSSAYALTGVHEPTGLILNLVSAVALLAAIAVVARAYAVPALVTFALLLAVVFLAPLPTLVLEGLEHVLQMLIDLAFLFCAITTLAAESPASSRRQYTWALLLSPLVTTVRYEGGFLLAIVCLMLLGRRRVRDAIALGVAGALPLAIFGAISLAHGWYFFPNSVLLKAQWLGGIPSASTVKQFLKASVRAEVQLIANPHLLVLVVASLALLIFHLRRARWWSTPVLWNTAYVGVALLHAQFAGMGWFYRYESYLVALGLIVCVITLPSAVWTRGAFTAEDGPTWPLRLATAALLILAAAPLVSRGASALVDTPLAIANIYQQQYQMGRFAQEFYGDRPIAANDIGLVTFFGTSPVVDLAGLASLPVAEAMRANRYDDAVIRRVSAEHGVQMAMLYDEWFKDTGIPREWKRVGQWTIPNRVAAARDTVSFYAVHPDAGPELIAHLQAFSTRLPKEVLQRGEYTNVIAEK